MFDELASYSILFIDNCLFATTENINGTQKPSLLLNHKEIVDSLFSLLTNFFSRHTEPCLIILSSLIYILGENIIQYI